MRIGLSLDKSEPYALHLSHGGFYFAGHNKQNDAESHRIEVYSADLSTKIKDINVPHTVETIGVLSPTEVLVVGKHFGSEWHGYFTVVSIANGNFSAKTTQLSTEFMPEFFAGTNGQLFFNEAGNAGVFRWAKSSGKMLTPKLSGPGRMAFTGKDLFVIERRDLFLFGDEQLKRINPTTQKAEAVFPTNRNGLSQVQYLATPGLIAVSEIEANLVHIIDPASNQVVDSFTSPSPDGLFPVGNCVAVSSRNDKQASLVLVGRNRTAKTLESWDLSALGDNILNTRHITADAASKRIYVRSQDLCPSCISSRNVVAVIENLEDSFKTCFEK